jgi:hypothetical protein
MVFHGNLFLGVGLKRFILQGYMLCCLVFALPFLVENKTKAFEEAITIICGAFALQGFIHMMGFLITPIGDFLFSMQPLKFQEAAEDPSRNLDKFRFYSLTGSPFFELPAAYGVACIVFFRLQLVPDQDYLKGWKAFVIMFLMFIGISLSGRTGFVGFLLGLLLYLIFNWTDFSLIWKNIVKISAGFLLLLAVFYVILTPQQRDSILNKLLPYAFEAYYNWKDTGEFNTASTDALEEAHYYSLAPEVVLWGTGGMSDDNPKFRHTDAGYMNNAIFGGIFYIVFLIIYQFIYFRQPMRLSRLQNSQDGNINFYCFLILFAHMFILEFKGPALGTQHITEVLLFYIGCSYIIKQYALEDEEDKSELAEKMIE